MTQSNFIDFCNDIVETYRLIEKKIGLKQLQDEPQQTIADLITVVSFIAIGYFASRKSNNTLLGAGIMAGLFASHIPFKALPSLSRGALLPMNRQGSFALQKIYIAATFLGKNDGFPTGFFMANSVYHFISENARHFKAMSGR